MHFIAILIVLGMLQYLGTVKSFHQDKWFDHWSKYLVDSFGETLLVYVIAVLIPSVLLFLLLLIIGGWGWGIVELAVFVLILAYSLGRGEFNTGMNAYVLAWEAGDYEKLPACIQSIDKDYLPDVGEGVQCTHVMARESFIYMGFTRLFVILFWFILLGPIAALIYRLTQLFLERYKVESVLAIRDVMEWPAARLYGLTFALVGDFTQTITSWLSTLLATNITNKQVVHANALAALDFNMGWIEDRFCETHSMEEQARKARKEIQSIKQLMNRSLIFSVIGIAIFQIVI